MYYYYIGNCTQNYYPKVYMGTTQTVTYYWNFDLQNTSKPPANQWPQNFGQTSQKGEANILPITEHYKDIPRLIKN